ncbi:MAG: hypothetical protein ACN6LP_00855 [Candidatus Carsonella ruddii]
MAKQSLIIKNINILKKSIINFKKILNIKKIIFKNKSLNNYFKLFCLNKKKMFVRFKNRCYISGRSRSYYRIFNLNRNFIRKIGSFGYLIGLESSSW